MTHIDNALLQFRRQGFFSLSQFVNAAREDGRLIERCPDCQRELTFTPHFPCEESAGHCEGCGWCARCLSPINQREVDDEAAQARREQRFKRRRA